MQKRKKRNIITALLMTTVLAAGIPCYAGTQQQIEEAEVQQEAAITSLRSMEEQLAVLEAKKGDTESYLAELNSQLEELSASLTLLQEQYAQKQEEKRQVEAELAAARELETQQYEDMKLRIRYIYEESTSAGLLESLFSAESFTDFLNRAEEMDQINRFDRDMLASYERTICEIEEKEQRLLQEEQSLLELKNAQEEQQNRIEALYENTWRELEDILRGIQDGENEQAALAARIREQEDLLNRLLAQKYAEEAAQRARAAAEAEAAAAEAAAQAAAQTAASYEAQPSAEETAQPDYTAPAPAEVLVQEIVAEAPAEEIAAEVPAPAETEAPAAEETGDNLTYLGNFTLTAYCACPQCCGKWSAYAGLTASGAYCQEGVTVAMGGVPFGTQLMINGHVYTVQDRGTPYGHVDIYFGTHAAACAFGMQYADVYQVN